MAVFWKLWLLIFNIKVILFIKEIIVVAWRTEKMHLPKTLKYETFAGRSERWKGGVENSQTEDTWHPLWRVSISQSHTPSAALSTPPGI